MKIGAENRKEVIAAVVLMAVAALLLMRMVFSSSSSAAVPTASVAPATPVPQPTDRRTTNSRGRRRVSMKEPPLINTLDPRLRLDLLKTTEDNVYEGRGRNIFRAQQEEIPKPVSNGRLNAGKEIPQPPPGPPPPPPINLKFYGFANKPGEA
ncbi:MAG TPA: hypothetical protein VE994_07895, partial [Terriglobales bacterium]|nr:hypothetical protein [Terriglobales bacterium]